MPYDTTKLKEAAIKVIKEEDLIFVEDVCALIGIAKSTYYDHFKEGSDDSNELSALLTKNKISTKAKLRKNWALQETNATMQMALYKLCSTPEEHRLLQQSYVEAKNEVSLKDSEFEIARKKFIEDLKNDSE